MEPHLYTSPYIIARDFPEQFKKLWNSSKAVSYGYQQINLVFIICDFSKKEICRWLYRMWVKKKNACFQWEKENLQGSSFPPSLNSIVTYEHLLCVMCRAGSRTKIYTMHSFSFKVAQSHRAGEPNKQRATLQEKNKNTTWVLMSHNRGFSQRIQNLCR